MAGPCLEKLNRQSYYDLDIQKDLRDPELNEDQRLDASHFPPQKLKDYAQMIRDQPFKPLPWLLLAVVFQSQGHKENSPCTHYISTTAPHKGHHNPYSPAIAAFQKLGKLFHQVFGRKNDHIHPSHVSPGLGRLSPI
ncbi:hypothetical protein CEXT_241471 [Caerostris extrusa]|uniref:Uncharacterized protein n=1 Tax=Caerostris extrusa TaxID=172846 RepID=A0AAV4TNK5_CAEEX|nr:hypothetical protein CEXT_241471 [Caerostris extrusa]